MGVLFIFPTLLVALDQKGGDAEAASSRDILSRPLFVFSLRHQRYGTGSRHSEALMSMTKSNDQVSTDHTAVAGWVVIATSI